MNYPQLFLPKEIIENFEKIFPLPVMPIPPIAPTRPSKSKTFFGFISGLALAIIFFFIQIPIISLIFIGISISALFSNSEKTKFEENLRKYNSEQLNYIRDLKVYEKEIKIKDSQNYQELKRNQSNERILKNSSKHFENKDYKKGVSHKYFKNYLVEHFGSSILENSSILNQRNSYNNNEFNLYITDFTYVDKYINLKIDIEIDEPYTFENKQAIHLNDDERNNFFLKNNWIVLRFAEEQVINNPELCCDYIKRIIECFYCNFMALKNLKSNIPEVEKWNLQSVKKLIEKDYRHSYLNDKIYVRL